MGRGKGKAPPGWVQAPSAVELEIRGVWQEDEMPDELKSSPGYRPFTLGIDAQAWVDSMAEIVDGGSAVYGRPRPATQDHHRSLATAPAPSTHDVWPSTWNPPQPPWTASPSAPAGPYPNPPPSPPRTPRVLMPDIEGEPAPPPRQRTLPPRVVMPDIASDEVRQIERSRHANMPEIGGADEPQTPKARQPTIPDIGAEEESPEGKRPLMPDIG